MNKNSLCVFDAYGTLFDVHSAVARHREAVGPQAERLSELWRTKQLEYTWTLSLMGEYRDFWVLTQEALDYAAARCGGISSAVRADLLAAYQTLGAFPDARACLKRLRAGGAQTAILSNGTPAMLKAAVVGAGLGGLLDAVLSVDEIRVFKTAPAAYEMVAKRFGPGEVMFFSSNRWDVAGAARFGFSTVWGNRGAMPGEYAGLGGEREVRGLGEVEGLSSLKLSKR